MGLDKTLFAGHSKEDHRLPKLGQGSRRRTNHQLELNGLAGNAEAINRTHFEGQRRSRKGQRRAGKCKEGDREESRSS